MGGVPNRGLNGGGYGDVSNLSSGLSNSSRSVLEEAISGWRDVSTASGIAAESFVRAALNTIVVFDSFGKLLQSFQADMRKNAKMIEQHVHNDQVTLQDLIDGECQRAGSYAKAIVEGSVAMGPSGDFIEDVGQKWSKHTLFLPYPSRVHLGFHDLPITIFVPRTPMAEPRLAFVGEDSACLSGRRDPATAQVHPTGLRSFLEAAPQLLDAQRDPGSHPGRPLARRFSGQTLSRWESQGEDSGIPEVLFSNLVQSS